MKNRFIKIWNFIAPKKCAIHIVTNSVCNHEHWGQCGFTNIGRCYDCNENFYFKTDW